MKKLFQKSKSGKTRDVVGEDGTKQQNIPTPLYQKLATHGAHIHGAISLPVFQQSTTQISPPSTEETFPTPLHPPPHLPSAAAPLPQASMLVNQQEPTSPLPNPHSPPTNGGGVGNSLMMRSNSFHSTPMFQALPGSPGVSRSVSPQTILVNGGGSIHTSKYAGSRFGGGGDHLDRKKPSPAVNAILNSLEPPKKDGALSGNGAGTVGTRSWGTIQSDDREGRFLSSVSDIGHGGYVPPVVMDKEREKEKKKGFWNVRDRDKEKERERDREQREREVQKERSVHLRKERQEREQRDRGRDISRREEDSSGELTRMIGYLTATAAEDWSLLMEVCERASSTEVSAKEAVRALRREFKYGEPPAQLSAARVWAVMLRNSSEIFISQSTSRKFLDVIEDLLSSSRTSPVVRERLLEVVAAAAYASGSKNGHENQGFKGLWKKVKPNDKPEEGVPFDTEDSMFQPPQSGRLSVYDSPTPNSTLDPTNPTSIAKRRSPSNQIIPLEEDMRRLFRECKIGVGNAAVLADALLRAKPEDLKKVDVIKEFHTKCLSSQELICAQIPWATSLAERSRSNNPPENGQQQQRSNTTSATTVGNNDGLTNSPVVELTAEEKLLADLLASNAELMEVLRQWEDLNRLAIERKVEEKSRRDVRINLAPDFENNISAPEVGQLHVSSSRPPSPPSRSISPVPASPSPLPLPLLPPPSSFHPDHAYQRRQTPSLYDSDSDPSVRSQSQQQQNLAPPPAAPHGPRSPAPIPVQRSTTSSPTPTPLNLAQVNGYASVERDGGDSDSLSSLAEEEELPVQPSAKALGKRKVIDVEVGSGQPADVFEKFHDNRQSFQSTNGLDPDFEDNQDSRWCHPPVRFVYDAVAERRRQLMSESRAHAEQPQGVY